MVDEAAAHCDGRARPAGSAARTNGCRRRTPAGARGPRAHASADTLAAMQLLRRTGLAALAFIVLLGAVLAAAAQEQPLRVGSKRFTESYILAEVLAQTAAPHTAVAPVVRQGLGNTAI